MTYILETFTRFLTAGLMCKKTADCNLEALISGVRTILELLGNIHKLKRSLLHEKRFESHWNFWSAGFEVTLIETYCSIITQNRRRNIHLKLRSVGFELKLIEKYCNIVTQNWKRWNLDSKLWSAGFES